jgi:hypothetical protein
MAELETQLLLCQKLQLLSKENVEHALIVSDEIGRMIRGLQKSLTKKAISMFLLLRPSPLVPRPSV